MTSTTRPYSSPGNGSSFRRLWSVPRSSASKSRQNHRRISAGHSDHRKFNWRGTIRSSPVVYYVATPAIFGWISYSEYYQLTNRPSCLIYRVLKCDDFCYFLVRLMNSLGVTKVYDCCFLILYFLRIIFKCDMHSRMIFCSS